MFNKASKKQSRLRLALMGPSGAGKTYTSLAIMSGLIGPGKRVAVIDTERGSASKYSDTFDFDVCELDSYDPRNYIEAIDYAANCGHYDAIVIDSLSHAWTGKDGILDKIDAKRGNGNDFTAWRSVTPQHNALVEALCNCRIHLAVTMRTKMEYVLEENEKGKKVPRKIGLAPVQRDGLEYEFDVVMDMDADNYGTVSKSRCEALTGKRFHKPNGEVSKILRAWLTDGVPMTPRTTAPQPPAGQAWQAWLALKAEYSLTDDVLKTAMRSLEIPSFKEADEGTRWVIVNHIRQAITPAGPPAGPPEPEPAAEPEPEAPTPPPAPVGRRAPVTVPASTETDILF